MKLEEFLSTLKPEDIETVKREMEQLRITSNISSLVAAVGARDWKKAQALASSLSLECSYQAFYAQEKKQ